MKTTNYAFLLDNVMKKDYRYAYDPKDLWEKASQKKIIKYNMSDVKHWAYSPCWSHNDNNNNNNNNDWFISIYQVLLQPKKFKDHMKRIKNADTSYPLIIVEDEYNKFGSILDGNHRFAKLLMEKKRVVNVVYFTKKELDKIKIEL